jgi:hypothetical protein
MLKIKDDVDLKELEKFGFIINKDCATYQNTNDEYIYIYSNKKIEIEFERFYDELDIGGPSLCHSLSNTLLNTLYDLIQAGLVEKVEG